MENTDKSASTDAPIAQPRDTQWIRLISYAKRKMDERTAKKQKEPPTDKAARVTANATIWIAFFTFVSVAVSVGTFLILKSQLKEMHDGGVDTHNLAQAAMDQATLSRQQLEGTMAAVVRLEEPRVTPDPITGRPILVMLLLNQENRVMARNAYVRFAIKTTSFPRTNTVLQSIPEMIEISQLSKSWAKNYTLFNFTKQDEQFATQKKTFTVEGEFGFDDGFDNEIEQPFCYSYIGFYDFKNEQTAGSTSGGGGFLPCDKFREMVAYLLAHPWK